MIWARFVWLFILFLLGRHICYPASDRYIELADSADYFIARENWDKAETTIIKALRLEPANFSNSLLFANLGYVQTQKGELGKAIESLTLGLNIAPSSTVLLNNRAHTFILSDSVDSASADLDRSLSIDSLQEWTLQTRAFIYIQEKDYERASSLLKKLKANFPKNSASLSGLATIAREQGEEIKAIELYKQALDLDPEDEETTQALILLLIKNEEYTEARTLLKLSIEKNPENPYFYLLRGYLHRLNFRNDEAKADRNLAIAKGLDPIYVSSFIP